jgi:hypothetical protein
LIYTTWNIKNLHFIVKFDNIEVWRVGFHGSKRR